MSEGKKPWTFFTGSEWKWNCLDFIIVLFSALPIGDNNIELLRLMRLLRIVKFFHHIPALRLISEGLLGGMKSITYIVILLLLVFYVYAIAGVYLFRDNDPWHFNSIETSMVALMGFATLSNWGDIMYVNYYGCDKYPMGLYTNDPAADQGIPGGLTYCANPIANPLTASAFSVSFIFVTAFCMLALFVGSVTLSMAQGLEAYRLEVDRLRRLMTFEDTDPAPDVAAAAPVVSDDTTGTGAATATASSTGIGSYAGIRNMFVCLDLSSYITISITTTSFLTRRAIGRLKLSFMGHPVESPQEILQLDQHQLQQRIDKSLIDTPHTSIGNNSSDSNSLRSLLLRRYVRLSEQAAYVAHHTQFRNFTTVCVLISVTQVGMLADGVLTAGPQHSFDTVAYVIQIIFVLECGMKVVAEELTPWMYFFNFWNVFDATVTVGSFFDGNGNMVLMLRLLRIFRVIRLMTSLPQLQVIVMAIMDASRSIGYASLLLVFFFYFFGVLGNILFAANDPWRFGTLHFTMVTLFQIITLDNWNDILYTNMYGCDVYGYGYFPWFCVDPRPRMALSTIYFAVFIVLGSFVLLSLFIGVVCNSLEEATKKQKSDLLVQGKVNELMLKFHLTEECVSIYRDVFQLLDVSQLHFLDKRELYHGFKTAESSVSSFEMERLWNEAITVTMTVGLTSSTDHAGGAVTVANKDRDRDMGRIDFSQFLLIMMLLRKDKMKYFQNIVEEKEQGEGQLTRTHKQGQEQRHMKDNLLNNVHVNEKEVQERWHSFSFRPFVGRMRMRMMTRNRNRNRKKVGVMGPASPSQEMEEDMMKEKEVEVEVGIGAGGVEGWTGTGTAVEGDRTPDHCTALHLALQQVLEEEDEDGIEEKEKEKEKTPNNNNINNNNNNCTDQYYDSNNDSNSRRLDIDSDSESGMGVLRNTQTQLLSVSVSTEEHKSQIP